jgi:hypothetical protein
MLVPINVKYMPEYVSSPVFPEFFQEHQRWSYWLREVRIAIDLWRFMFSSMSIHLSYHWIMQSRKISNVTCRWHKILCSIHFWKVLNSPESPIGIAWLTNNLCFGGSFNRTHQTECCFFCLSDTVAPFEVALSTSSLWAFFEFALSTLVV